MRNIHIDYRGPDHDFQVASMLAKDAAKENQMKDPTIISWHQSSRVGLWSESDASIHIEIPNIHPLRRHAEGYPAALAHGVLCNANGLAMLSGMQAVVLSGAQSLQREVLNLGARHSSCMPPPL